MDLLVYVAGQLAYLGWPLLPLSLGIGQPWQWSLSAYWLWLSLIAFTVSTLFGPVGMCRRYQWLTSGTRLGYERLFVGQVPAQAVIHVTGRGTVALLREFGAMAAVLILGPSLVNYLAWLGYGTKAFILNSSISTSSVGLWDFLYHSVVTITTTGYGDIVPHHAYAQIVSVSQVLLGWMYVIGIVPLVLSTLQQRSLAQAVSGIKDMSRGGLLRATVRRGLEKLRNRLRGNGSWCTSLSPDAVSMFFAIWVLEEARRDLPVPKELITSLRKASRDLTGANDGLARALRTIDDARLAGDTGTAVDSILRCYRSQLHVSISSEGFPLWVAMMAQAGLSEDARQALASIKRPSVDKWQCDYGEHWATYASSAELLVAHLEGHRDIVDRQAHRLKAVRAKTGSWFGDCLLTSACALALARANRQRMYWHGAALWLVEAATELNGLPLVRSLDVWHTALTMEMLHYAGIDCTSSALWLQAQCVAAGDQVGWSWSSESSCICLDSTSTAVHALRALEMRDLPVERCLRQGMRSLAQALCVDHNGMPSMPTFLGGDTAIDPCPIVLSRAITLIPLEPKVRRRFAEHIADLVASGEVSPWFSCSSITKGLVLWHIGPYLPMDTAAAKQLVEELIEKTQQIVDGQNVSAGSVLLGLMGSRHCTSHTTAREAAIERLVNVILANAIDGEWAGERVSVYGFGRQYCDDHLATVLALRSLMEYSCS